MNCSRRMSETAGLRARLGKLRRYLQNSVESAKSTAPSRGALWAQLSKGYCFNAGIMSRARKQAVGEILQVPLQTRARKQMAVVIPWGLLFGLAISITGCGYHVGGQGDLIPKNVKTIAIPEFSNGTVQYQVAPLITADVVREFHSRTHYTIVTDRDQADAVLSGGVVRFDVLGGITTDPVTNRATSSQIVLNIQFTLTDRKTGKVIYQRSGYEFRERYEISTSLPTYFDESSPAMKRVTRAAAAAVVTSILEAF